MVRSRFARGWPMVAAFILLALLAIFPNVLLWQAFDRLGHERSQEHLFWVLCQPGYTGEERRQAFSDLLWQGNREWRAARLERLDLSGALLANADIQLAHMEGCCLKGADLSGAILRRTQFDQADLSNANLADADMFEADLLKADLRKAVLTRADLRGSDIGQSDATNARLDYADLTGSKLDLAILVGADLRLARLIEADLSLANLTSAQLYGADLSGADLTMTNFTDSNWWRTKGLSAELIADFQERFPPTSAAEESTRLDYENWLAEIAKVPPQGEPTLD